MRQEGISGMFEYPGPFGRNNYSQSDYLAQAEAFVKGFVNGEDSGTLTEICGDNMDNNGNGQIDEAGCVPVVIKTTPVLQTPATPTCSGTSVNPVTINWSGGTAPYNVAIVEGSYSSVPSGFSSFFLTGITNQSATKPDLKGGLTYSAWISGENINNSNLVQFTTPSCTVAGTYNLSATASPTSGGSISGAGTYNSGTSATIQAIPAAGYTFNSWSGDATGNINPKTITMNGNKNVTATFALTNPTIAVVPVVSVVPIATSTLPTLSVPISVSIKVYPPLVAKFGFGQRGAAVAQLQQMLTTDGVFKGTINSYYDTKTRQAVTKFQTKYGISTTGLAGPLTRAKLNQLYARVCSSSVPNSSFSTLLQLLLRLQSLIKK
jgi:uncharacterized repeat protein (TIGR02543 family)